MLPCPRSRAGRHLKCSFAFLHNHIYTEPLLFLYPQWLQRSVQESRRSYLHRIRTVQSQPSIRHQRNKDHPPRLPNSSSLDLPTGQKNTRTISDRRARVAQSSTPDQGFDDYSNSAINSTPAQAVAADRSASVTDLVEDASTKLESEIFKTSDITQVLKVIQDNGGRFGQAHSKKHQHSFNASTIDGQALSSLLVKIPPGRSHRYDERLILPASFLHKLTGTSQETSWFHWLGTGCRITVLALANDEAVREVLLSGSRAARAIAKTYLADQAVLLEPESPTTVQPGSDGAASGTLVDLFWKPDQPREAAYRVEDLTPPKHWSIRNFYEYISVITNRRLPRTVERQLYPGQTNYNRATAAILRYLFVNPELRKFQSTAALLQALRFCRQGTELAATSSCIWNGAHEASVLPDLDCFNVEIDRCLTVNNVDRVTYLFNQMTVLGVSPDTKTWALVLRRMNDWKDRLSMIGFLLQNHKRRFSTTYDKQLLAQVIIEMDFGQFVQDGNGLSQFNDHMEEVFDSTWKSPASIAAMIKQCISIGMPELVSDVLALAEASKVEMKRETYIALLEAILTTGHIRDAMNLLKTPLVSNDRSILSASIIFAFKTAWTRHMANMCRVLWAFAISHGFVSYNMQRGVVHHLEQNATTSHDAQSTITPKLMAAITIHADLSMSEVAQRFPVLAKAIQVKSCVDYLCQGTQSKEVRHEQLQLMHFLVERNLTAWKRYQPMEVSKLHTLLQTAHQLDEDWLESKNQIGSSASEDLKRAIRIELQPLTSSMGSSLVRRRPSRQRVTKDPIQHSIDKWIQQPRNIDNFACASLTQDIRSTTTTTSADLVLMVRSPNILEVIFQLFGLRWRTA